MNDEKQIKKIAKYTMLFSKRNELAEEYKTWVNQPLKDGAKIKDCPLSVITFLISKGFILLSEDSVVLPKEEFERLKNLEKNYENMANGYYPIRQICDELKLQARRETAGECRDFIKQWVGNDEACLGFLFDFEDFIAKEYGVEVENE